MRVRIIEVLESLDRRLHPSRHRGLRWRLWCLVNAGLSFFSFWQNCYGCGTLQGCTCPAGEPAAFSIDFRTAASVAWGIWKPVPMPRPRIRRRISTFVPASEAGALADRLLALHETAEVTPWKVESGKKFSGNNWLLASFGQRPDVDEEVWLTTDSVHGSDCRGNGPFDDATLCAEVRNLLPQIITALRSRAAFEDARAEAKHA